ncbi:hypothetical protein DL546_006581 [Coniochaeta pulveracea]|uniref:Uncharacterized protein n=1 Tax=Coniochaeta pulveracea TaxID=177199 RepID=A0A420YJH9_9PEZI|nr:hypothetical protein DL546_006581 [Coniochaeta pulveracea]
MSAKRSLTEEREQQLAEARALRQGYQQSGTFHANGSRGGRSKPRTPGGRASQPAGRGRGGMQTTSQMSAGNRAYVGPGTQRYSNQISFGSLPSSSTGNRRTEHRSAPAQRANVANVSAMAPKPQTRVISYYQDNSNDLSGVTSSTTATAAPPTALRDLSAPAAGIPVVTTTSLPQAALIKATSTAGAETAGLAQHSVSQARSSIAHDWNTAQVADEVDSFDVDPDFGSGTVSSMVSASDHPIVNISIPVVATIAAQPRGGSSVPGAAANNNTPSATRLAPNTVWHWNYQDETAGPDIIPVEPVAADLDAMDVDDQTPSPLEIDPIWNRPAKKRIPCSCARGLGQSRWAEASCPTPTSHGLLSHQPQSRNFDGLCPIHGDKNRFRSDGGHNPTNPAGGN